MKITIDEQKCKENNMSVPEVLGAILHRVCDDVYGLFENMYDKEILTINDKGEPMVTMRWSDVVDTIILDSDDVTQTADRLDNLVTRLQDVFPKGKKEGTSQYWRGNKREITLRLKKFFKLYGNTYSDDQIINAAKDYVQGFNSQYQFMRVLKYFIWKDDRRRMEDGEIKVVEVSDLANYIENAGQVETLRDEWTSSLN